MSKKILVITTILSAFFGFVFVGEVKADTDDNVGGWAWSENIGWVSFNCTNQDWCATSDYGVNIDPSTGVLSGQAWSENVDWISFDAADLAGCPQAPCEAKLDIGTMEVSGWAKALAAESAESGGWDGWIKLRGDITCGGSVTFTYKGAEVTYGTVEHNGECWMDRNLGASQVATARDDSNAYGDLFQWGRCDDGHQNRGSVSYSGPVNTDACEAGNPWDGDFVTISADPWDWLISQNDNLWQGVSGTNNPCPDGWRIPTEAEWQGELDTPWSSNDYNGAYNSPLRLTAGGFRASNAVLANAGSYGYYWSSTVDGTFASYLVFGNSSAGMVSFRRANAFSVRCVRDGGNSYGVSLNTETNEFEGWAWGGDDSASEAVIGWLSWNRINCDPNENGTYEGSAEGAPNSCPSSGTAYDYYVYTTVSFGPGISNLSESLTPCSQSRVPTLSWDVDPADDYEYQIQIDDDSDFSSPIIDATGISSGGSGSWTPSCSYCCDVSPYNSIAWGGNTYYWQVRAYEVGESPSGNFTKDLSGFTTEAHCYPYPYFLCSYDQLTWYDCDGENRPGIFDIPLEYQSIVVVDAENKVSGLPQAPAPNQEFYIMDFSTSYNQDNSSFASLDCSNEAFTDGPIEINGVTAFDTANCPETYPVTSYQRTLGGVSADTSLDFESAATSSITFLEDGTWTVFTTTTDAHSPDQSCGCEEGGGTGLPLPIWREIAPY